MQFNLNEWAAVIVISVIVSIAIYKVFAPQKDDLVNKDDIVKKEDLEKKHREILEDAEKKFVTLTVFAIYQEQLKEMKDKIDKIYDCLIENKGA